MQAGLSLYAKLSALLIVLSLIVGSHYAFRGLRHYPKEPKGYIHAARPERGKAMILAYGCGACHVIPGVAGASGKVGPRLNETVERVYIAGVLPNSPQNLVRWIRDPQDVDPLTAMPDLNVGPQDARDIAAYLYTLE